MKPLLLLELRRQRRVAGRMALLTILVGVVFFIAGKRAPADFLAIVIGSSLGTVLIVPMGVARDKMEGTLDFICGLPVDARDIAASRFAAVAIFAIPWAASIGVVSTVARTSLQLNPAGVAMFAWLVLCVLGACGTALLARYDFENMLGAPILALVIPAVLLPRAIRALMPGVTPEQALQSLARPEYRVVIAGVVLGSMLVIGTAAFRFAERALDSYRPDSTQR